MILLFIGLAGMLISGAFTVKTTMRALERAHNRIGCKDRLRDLLPQGSVLKANFSQRYGVVRLYPGGEPLPETEQEGFVLDLAGATGLRPSAGLTGIQVRGRGDHVRLVVERLATALYGKGAALGVIIQ